MRIMEFTPRVKQILQVMLQEDQVISVKQLADHIGLSKRTTQRELEYISSDLKAYDIVFMRKTGVGVWLEGSPEGKARLQADISQGDTYDVTNREERRKRLVLEILRDKGLKKLFHYSSQFGVSEATISGDLEAVGEWLGRHKLFVTRKPGSGISIEGSEESYRKAIRSFIAENIDTKVVRESYDVEERPASPYRILENSSLTNILNDDILKRVVNAVMGMNDERVLTLTESSYVGLVLHISIAINRILKDEIIEENENWTGPIARDADYALAKAIVVRLEEEFQVDIPEIEISYICLHIKGAKHQKIAWNNDKTLEIEKKEMMRLVNEMINAFDKDRAFALRQDEEFIQGLLAHLQPTMIRLLYDMQIQNPVLEEIKQGYAEIYSRCERVAQALEKWTKKAVPESEIGFLTVHFGAAVVRMEAERENIRQVAVGVVCASGIGISRLMSSKLEKTFKDRIAVVAYGKSDVTPYITGKTDFFVSSIPLEAEDDQVVYVNPLLNEEDMEAIRHKVFYYERQPGKEPDGTKFSQQLDTINLIAAQIKTIIKYMGFFQVDKEITFEELVKAVSVESSPYTDQREMIWEDIMNREKIGTQVFAEFGFALFHTRTKGVSRPGFTVCMTKDLSPFTDPYFKGIQVILVMLLPVDEHLKENSAILGHISSALIEDYNFLETISRGEKEEIRALLSEHLSKFFRQYLANM